MPRVTVQDDEGVVYMSENIHPGMLDDERVCVPWLERLCWALWDALPETDRVITERPVEPLSKSARQRLAAAPHV